MQTTSDAEAAAPGTASPTPQQPIFIVAHQLFSARYLLGTDIFRRLRDLGAPVVIVSPNADEPSFRREFGGDGVTFERFRYDEMGRITGSRLYRFFMKARWLTLPARLDIFTVKFHERLEALNKAEAGFLGARYIDLILLTARLLRRSRVLREWFVRLENRLFRSDFHRDLFEKHRPSLAVVTDVGTIHLNNLFMAEARRHGVPVASVVLSWDNLTSKGLGGALPDYAVAWNETMKEELVQYHGMDPARVAVAGVAHYDGYYRNPAPDARGEFLERFGLSGDRKTIFVGTASPNTFRRNADLIELLLRAIEAGRFTAPCQLLVRIHPIYLSRMKRPDSGERRRLDELRERYPCLLRINYPQTVSQAHGAIFAEGEEAVLEAILRHSDVMVNLFSTLMLEACIFDLPVVNVAFYDYRDTNLSNRMLQDFTHIRKFLRHGAARTAFSEEELIAHVNAYLQDRRLDAAPRALVREREGGPNKGEAGKRIAEHIFHLARGSARTPIPQAARPVLQENYRS